MEGDRSFTETLRKAVEEYDAAWSNLTNLERLLAGIEPDAGLEPAPVGNQAVG